VAEKESLSGDRDMLIQQITNSSTEIGVLKETVLSLKKKITESNAIIQKLTHDLKCEHEVCVNKDMMIKEQKEDIIQCNLMSTTDLTKISEELVESLKENGILGNHVQTLEEVLCKERAAREKERQALSLALSNIDELASKLKISQIKSNELDDNNNKLSLLQQEYDDLKNENFKFQKDIMLLHSQLNEAEENTAQCELKIVDLREEKKEILEAEEKENFNHKNKVSELEMIIANFEISIKNNEIASNLKCECYQNEIDRLSYELQKSENEIYQKHELNTKFQIDIRNLEEKHNKEMEEKIKNENLEKMVKRSAEVQLTVGELVLSLQANRLLSEEIIILKNKLDKEEKKRKLIEENSLEKISSKTSELDSVIESNKYALVRASSQINEMKISLTDLKREKEEIERRFQNSETYTETVRTSLQEAMNELEKIMLSKKALQKELFRVIKEREEEVVLKVSTGS
jgi:chromosome segregation ATPase